MHQKGPWGHSNSRGISPVLGFQFWLKSESKGLNGAQPRKKQGKEINNAIFQSHLVGRHGTKSINSLSSATQVFSDLVLLQGFQKGRDIIRIAKEKDRE
jgi:hypothetical protein